MKAPAWLQNAIDRALLTAQRRTDILDMRFDSVREKFLYLVQKKTAWSEVIPDLDISEITR